MTPAGSHDPRFQRRYTVFFTAVYFTTLLAFITLGASLFLVPNATFSQDVRDVMFFLFGLIGPLVGFQTKTLGDHNQYHYGSSVGSKSKDEKTAALT